MKYPAYFLSPYGDIMPITSDRHINEVWENPEKFGFTIKELEAIFKRHKEKRGTEGNAREEVIASLIKKGWGRVRYIPSNDSYTVQIQNLDNTQKENLYDWAKIATKDAPNGKHTGVAVMELKSGGSTMRGTLEDITRFKMFSEMKRTRKSKAITFIENYIAKNEYT
jgi:hypothetical protein